METDRQPVDSPEALLQFLREFGEQFEQRRLDALDAMSRDGHTQNMDALLADNCRALVGLPDHLGPEGLAQLTVTERMSLMKWVGVAQRALDRINFTWMTTLCRDQGDDKSLFDHIVERLDGQSAPRLLAARQIAALDAHAASPLFPGTRASQAIAAGLTLETGDAYVEPSGWPRILEAAFVILGYGVKGGFPTPGAFLYSLGFRVPLDA
jgi:hypothetical protein